jgi:hypothetical protein
LAFAICLYGWHLAQNTDDLSMWHKMALPGGGTDEDTGFGWYETIKPDGKPIPAELANPRRLLSPRLTDAAALPPKGARHAARPAWTVTSGALRVVIEGELILRE